VAYFPHRADLPALVPAYARPGDVVLTLGGGDITTLPDEMLARAPARGGGG
jgi:UDP-N-acetylmuramate--alanine ligase